MGMVLKKVNVTNTKRLIQLGYDPNQYHCGNHQWVWFYTNVRKTLEAIGVPFPYNQACWIHDLDYNSIWNSKLNFWQVLKYKLKSDVRFYHNMDILLKNYLDLRKDTHKRVIIHLQRRKKVYFLLVVTIGTVGYMGAWLWRKVNGRKKKK